MFTVFQFQTTRLGQEQCSMLLRTDALDVAVELADKAQQRADASGKDHTYTVLDSATGRVVCETEAGRIGGWPNGRGY